VGASKKSGFHKGAKAAKDKRTLEYCTHYQ